MNMPMQSQHGLIFFNCVADRFTAGTCKDDLPSTHDWSRRIRGGIQLRAGIQGRIDRRNMEIEYAMLKSFTWAHMPSMISPSFSSGISRGVCQGVGLLKPTLAMVWSSSICTTFASQGIKDSPPSFSASNTSGSSSLHGHKAFNPGTFQASLCKVNPGSEPFTGKLMK